MRKMRKQPRVLTLKTATIKFETMESAILCAILNISDAGACILVSDQAEIPETFELEIDPLGSNHTCRVEWRSENRIGVSFQSSTSN
jgi:hypothetical protein